MKVVPFLQFCSEDFCSTVGGCSQVTQDINYNLLGEKKVPRTGSQLCSGKDRTFFSCCCLPNILRPSLEQFFESPKDLEGAAAHADTEWELSLTSCWMEQVLEKSSRQSANDLLNFLRLHRPYICSWTIKEKKRSPSFRKLVRCGEA